jgi:hypothetical protein
LRTARSLTHSSPSHLTRHPDDIPLLNAPNADAFRLAVADAARYIAELDREDDYDYR